MDSHLSAWISSIRPLRLVLIRVFCYKTICQFFKHMHVHQGPMSSDSEGPPCENNVRRRARE